MKHIKILAIGAAYLAGLSVLLIACFLPMGLAAKMNDNRYLLGYMPHLLLLMYIIGGEIYETL